MRLPVAETTNRTPDHVASVCRSTLLAIIFAAGLCAPGSAGDKATSGQKAGLDRFRALLSELRKLQAAAAQESAAWKAESEGIRRLREMTAAEDSENRDELKRLEAELRSIDEEVAKAKTEGEGRLASEAQLRKTVAECAGRLHKLLMAAKVPASDGLIERVVAAKRRAQDDTVQLSDVCSEFWSLALEWTAWAGEVAVLRRQENIAGTQKDVFLLRVGSACCYAVTADGTKAWVWASSNRAWRELSPGVAGPLRRAVDVVQKRRAPELVTLPLPGK